MYNCSKKTVAYATKIIFTWRKIMSSIANHEVTDAVGYVPQSVFNHNMRCAAPGVNHIVNHDLKDCSSEAELARVLGVFRYPGRALGSTNPGDVIQLHPDLQSEWLWIIRHYQQIGLSHASEVIWDDNMNIMSKFPQLTPSVFFFGEKAHQSRPDQSWYEIVKLMNSKNRFMTVATDLNVPVPFTLCFESKNDFDGCVDIEFPAYLKVSRSVSGLGVILCRDLKQLEQEISQLESDVSFQIQEDLGSDIVFLNIQYRVQSDGVLQRVLTTEQILDGCQHNGNRFPACCEPWEITDPLAKFMFDRGMKGYFAFDVAVTNGGYRVIECNPRYNGASYPTNIALKMGLSQWSAKGLKTRFDSLSCLDLGHLQYNQDKESGVIVFNWGCVKDGKIGVMFVGNTDHQRVQETELMRIIA